MKHGYDEKFGARPLKRAIQTYIEDPLSEKILLGEFAKGDEIEVDRCRRRRKLDFRVLSEHAESVRRTSRFTGPRERQLSRSPLSNRIVALRRDLWKTH